MLTSLKQWILVSICLVMSGVIFAEPLGDAMKAYDKGAYKEAVQIYEDLVKQGSSNGAVFYNLGNAYFRSGEKGKAMAAYLAARSLLPRDPDIKANLKFVHDQMVDKLSIRSSGSVMRDLSFWLDMGTAKEFLFVASFLSSVALCLLFIS